MSLYRLNASLEGLRPSSSQPARVSVQPPARRLGGRRLHPATMGRNRAARYTVPARHAVAAPPGARAVQPCSSRLPRARARRRQAELRVPGGPLRTGRGARLVPWARWPRQSFPSPRAPMVTTTESFAVMVGVRPAVRGCLGRTGPLVVAGRLRSGAVTTFAVPGPNTNVYLLDPRGCRRRHIRTSLDVRPARRRTVTSASLAVAAVRGRPTRENRIWYPGTVWRS